MNILNFISPAFALVVLLGVIYGGLYHLLRGRIWKDLGIALLAALAGMALGQLLGAVLGLDLLKMGQVYLLEGTLCAWASLFAVAWLRG